MATVKVKQGQSLLDIAVQYTGSVENAFSIALLNSISLADQLEINQELIVPEPTNRSIVALFSDKNIPASYKALTEAQLPETGGIGEMIIEQTFIVN